MSNRCPQIGVALTIVLGPEQKPGQRRAEIQANGMTIFSEIVYDNEHSSAERNIMLLFSDRLRTLLERDD